MSGTKSKVSDLSSSDIEAQLQQTVSKMQQCQKEGKYIDAESFRMSSEKLKKDLDQRRVYEMETRQREQKEETQKAQQDEINAFHTFWDAKIKQYNAEGERLDKELLKRHENEIDKLKEDLERQLPTKVKESSECLNLRKMEEHMAKQKNYVEAHRVQQRVKEIEESEKVEWGESRRMKIDIAMNTLRLKQQSQLAALQKRIRSGADQQAKEREEEYKKLYQKYVNVAKQLKSQHEKELISLKGQFKSKGGIQKNIQ